MTVRTAEDAIHLEGRCLAEDAEELLFALRETGLAIVDLSAAVRLHLAVVQVLLALRPELRGVPQNAFAARHLMVLLG